MATTKEPNPKGTKPSERPGDRQTNVLGGLGEAQRQYCDELQRAWSPLDAQARSAAAYADYMKASVDAGLDPSRSFDAYLQYARALQEAWLPEDAMERSRAAFQNYLRGVQAAWAGLDPDNLDLNTLANLSCHMTTVMLHASSYPPQGPR